MKRAPLGAAFGSHSHGPLTRARCARLHPSTAAPRTAVCYPLLHPSGQTWAALALQQPRRSSHDVRGVPREAGALGTAGGPVPGAAAGRGDPAAQGGAPRFAAGRPRAASAGGAPAPAAPACAVSKVAAGVVPRRHCRCLVAPASLRPTLPAGQGEALRRDRAGPGEEACPAPASAACPSATACLPPTRVWRPRASLPTHAPSGPCPQPPRQVNKATFVRVDYSQELEDAINKQIE